jgi:hypothetical protein
MRWLARYRTKQSEMVRTRSDSFSWELDDLEYIWSRALQ